MNLSPLRCCVLIAACLPVWVMAQVPSEPPAWFLKNPAWSRAAEVSMPEGASKFEVSGAGSGNVLYFSGDAAKAEYLVTQAYLGDCIIHAEFLLTPDAKVGVFVEGRFKIELSAAEMGRLGPPAETKPAEGLSPVPNPLVNAAEKVGTWQTLDIRFRAPRQDEARNLTQQPVLLEVRINGKVVQKNTVPAGRSRGAGLNWDDATGPSTIGVEQGSVAFREFSIRRADFEPVQVPQVSGKPTNEPKLVDFVKQGEDLFRGLGCVECHAVQRDDASMKTGPNLFGLFRLEPRDRVIAANEGHRFTIKADRSYLQRSIRTPHDELAISERGPTLGQPYPPIMPPYAPTVITDTQIEAVGSYLATLNEPVDQGPVVRLVEETGPKNYDPMTDRLQLLVSTSLRMQRGPMEGVSARAIHVAQTNGINYSFDPRVLAIAKVWQGGFIDATGEYLNRGGQGFKPGYESREIELGEAGVLLAPVDANGQRVDFSFKDPKFRDGDTIREALNSTIDPLTRLEKVDAQFLGYSWDSSQPESSPFFKYRVGKNRIAVRAEIAADGKVTLTLDGEFAAPQSFAVNETVLGQVKVTVGKIENGRWTVPAGSHHGISAAGKLTVAQGAWRPKASTFNYERQPVVVEPSTSKLPAGYKAETYVGPKDNYGREQLFEPLGIAVAPDGTIIVATRTAGIWRLSKGEWQLYAEGLFDGLGVQVEDEHGYRLVVGQKAELTRLTDTNGDGRADNFDTMMDQFTYTGNYHAYMHGPVSDGKGGYFVTLNLNDSAPLGYEYMAGGKYMGTSGGYRGWAIHVTADGKFEPWADGLRSPAGLGMAPDGRLWYADNQGEYVATSKFFLVKRGAFYGHPSGLVDRPGMTPASPEIRWDAVKATREKPVVLFPQSRLANSPGNPVWDATGGKFGPYAGQIFIGDQTQSNLMRVVIEKVGDHEQGAVIPFSNDLQSGVMRPVFLPDGSLLLGQTGRGWQAKGGRVASLQRIVWDGTTVPPSIHHVAAAPDGFDVAFTTALPSTLSDPAVRATFGVKSWTYRDAPDYGSPELDEHPEGITKVTISADRKTVHVKLEKTEQPAVHADQTARVYQITVAGRDLWGAEGAGFQAFYTLYAFPSANR